MMRCPHCHNDSISLWQKMTSNRSNPLVCRQCTTHFYVKRPFSTLYEHVVLHSGVIFLALFLAFAAWSWLGFSLVLFVAIGLHVMLLFIETKESKVMILAKKSLKKSLLPQWINHILFIMIMGITAYVLYIILFR